MIVAGVMSGTSADGINVALVRIVRRGRLRPRASGSTNLAFKFLAHAEYPYPKNVRQAVLQA
ncbi:MAG: anhydro-N-acetylmuramic acid kinase, partial [Terriglobales bacterium]